MIKGIGDFVDVRVAVDLDKQLVVGSIVTFIVTHVLHHDSKLWIALSDQVYREGHSRRFFFHCLR